MQWTKSACVHIVSSYLSYSPHQNCAPSTNDCCSLSHQKAIQQSQFRRSGHSHLADRLWITTSCASVETQRFLSLTLQENRLAPSFLLLQCAFQDWDDRPVTRRLGVTSIVSFVLFLPWMRRSADCCTNLNFMSEETKPCL
ncbi:hypothetical protein AC579_7353, partial [Pseudocercospora musae]